jgi:hypothetical protein
MVVVWFGPASNSDWIDEVHVEDVEWMKNVEYQRSCLSWERAIEGTGPE